MNPPQVDGSVSHHPAHLAYLDALRGYAIIGVFLAHALHDFTVHIPKSLRFCGFGVTLFYVLSAFCLMLSLSRESKPVNWRAYFFRRFFRIAPAFYFAVVVWSLIYFISGRSLNPAITLSSIIFINGFIPDHIGSAIPHGWSIAIETSFYVILPFLFLSIRSLNQAIRLLVVVTPLSIVSSWAIPRIFTAHACQLQQYTVYWLPAQIPVFLIGITAFHTVYGNCKLSSFIRSCCSQGRLLPSFIIGSMVLSAGYLPTRIAHIVLAMGCAFWIIWMSAHRQSIFVNAAVVRIGLISFSAYLFHQAGIDIVKHHLSFSQSWSPLLGISFAAVLAFIFGVIGYFCIEQPGIRLGSQFIKK